MGEMNSANLCIFMFFNACVPAVNGLYTNSTLSMYNFATVWKYYKLLASCSRVLNMLSVLF